MNPVASNSGYTRTAIVLHWLPALAIFATFALGLYMHELPDSPRRLKLYDYHKWAGISTLALSALRLLWRPSRRAPPDAPMQAWQARAAHTAHALLYVLFFALPLSGWAYSSAAGIPVVVFGLLPLPDLASPDKTLAETLKGLHQLFAVSRWFLGTAGQHPLADSDRSGAPAM